MESLATNDQDGKDGLEEGKDSGDICSLDHLVLLASSTGHLHVHEVIMNVLHVNRSGFGIIFFIQILSFYIFSPLESFFPIFRMTIFC